MKPNITSVSEFLPNISFSKCDLSECAFILRHRNEPIRKLDREIDSKTIADIFLNEILVERKNKAEQEKLKKQKVSILYRICMPYRVDCYSASCRFMEYKFSEFIECPDRIPANKEYTEQQGYWWNTIVNKTGYFKESCGDLCRRLDIKSHEIFIVDTLLDEYKTFIQTKHKILHKYFKSCYVDYSHMAYNNSADDF